MNRQQKIKKIPLFGNKHIIISATHTFKSLKIKFQYMETCLLLLLLLLRNNKKNIQQFNLIYVETN